MTSEVCVCGHTLDDHDFDDYFNLGCILCDCEVFEEEDEVDI